MRAEGLLSDRPRPGRGGPGGDRAPQPSLSGRAAQAGPGAQTRVGAGEGRPSGGKDSKFKAAHRSPPGAAGTTGRPPPPRAGCTARARAGSAASAAGALGFAM